MNAPSFGVRYLMVNRQVSGWTTKGWTMHQVFDEIANANPQKTAIRLEEITWNYKELQEFSLRVANYFQDKGYKKGDIVALLMENHPRYVGIWLGLSRIGVITALLNTGLKLQTLNFAVTTATKDQCKTLITSPELLKVVEELQNSEHKFNDDIKLYIIGGKPETSLQNLEVLDFPVNAPFRPVDEATVKSLTMSDSMVYVYTSGTTGNPKAATFTFKRFAFLATGAYKMLGLRKKDILYTPMPMYHASGGLLGTGQMMMFGITMVIKKKFTKTYYFPDCKKYEVTVAQYIGEMCSYLYSLPPSPADKDHKVRLMIGNGLRRSLWKNFQKRFNIKQIGEFYGSTEGNANMINTNNKVGSVGFLPWFAGVVYPLELIEYDPDTYEPLRNKHGRCIRASPKGFTTSVKGLLIGGVKKTKSGTSDFEGYTDKKATEKKIITNCFKEGDRYFNSGDVLERDLFNNYYFLDRLGDTFRWKGENVAASQVESIITTNMNLSPDLVAVYGVQVGKLEGRAGMAALAVEDDNLDKKKLAAVCNKFLSKEQIPIFLRITSNLPMTPTSKIKKTELQKQGWNPAEITANGNTDKLYFYQKSSYVPLTQDMHDQIVEGKIQV